MALNVAYQRGVHVKHINEFFDDLEIKYPGRGLMGLLNEETFPKCDAQPEQKLT